MPNLLSVDSDGSEEQSDQDLHCLPFSLHPVNAFLYSKASSCILWFLQHIFMVLAAYIKCVQIFFMKNLSYIILLLYRFNNTY